MRKTRVIVIGGGASGMMAAGRAGELGCDVVLLEKMHRLGRKLRITGKGRCNITNIADLEEFILHYGKNGKFLYNCFSKFFNTDLIDFFEEKGVKTVVERGKRVFPKSSAANEIVCCLIEYLKENGVAIRTNFKVSKIITNDNKVTGVKGEHNEMVNADGVIVATGGMSYPLTGSTGDGYTFARDLGHMIVAPEPGLVPIEIEEKYVTEMQGLSLKNVEVTAFINGKKFAQTFGEMLFTHFGVSGPIILTISKGIVKRLGKGTITLSINFKPVLTRDVLENRILREFDEFGRMKYRNILKHLLPNKAIPVFVKLSEIPAHRQGGVITREERLRLVELLSNFEMTVKGTRTIDEAIVTSGGIVLDEINPTIMESKIIRGLFFSGEVIDIDGDTGGYNLQAAFSTGYCAGEGVSVMCTKEK